MLTAEAITARLRHPLPAPVLYETTDSTNTRCKLLAEEGAPEGTFVIAGHQTAGRGRMGRSFFSPEHTGLYMSLLLRPAIFCYLADAVYRSCCERLLCRY